MGVQITLFPLYDKKDFKYSFGLSYLHKIKVYKYSQFLLFASNHFTNFYSHSSYFYNLGFGMGIDLFFIDPMVFNFMLGYAGIDIFDDFKTRPTIEFGAFYNF